MTDGLLAATDLIVLLKVLHDAGIPARGSQNRIRSAGAFREGIVSCGREGVLEVFNKTGVDFDRAEIVE